MLYQLSYTPKSQRAGSLALRHGLRKRLLPAGRPRSCLGRDSLAALAEHRFDRGSGDRLGEDIALDTVASKGPDQLQLLLAGDAFRDRLHAEAAGKGDDGADDRRALRILRR